MWGRVSPSPGADVAGVSPCSSADVAGVSPSPGADVSETWLNPDGCNDEACSCKLMRSTSAALSTLVHPKHTWSTHGVPLEYPQSTWGTLGVPMEYPQSTLGVPGVPMEYPRSTHQSTGRCARRTSAAETLHCRAVSGVLVGSTHPSSSPRYSRVHPQLNQWNNRSNS